MSCFLRINKQNICSNTTDKIFPTYTIVRNLRRALSTYERNSDLYENLQHRPRQDKSKLLRHNRNVLFHIVPYEEPSSWIHLTEKYRRKMFGVYGLASGITPYICFSKCDEPDSMDIAKEPYTLQQLMLNKKNVELHRKKSVESREQEVASKLDKLEHWKMEMRNKIAKKEAAALSAKEQKQRLMEEVRRHFGFNVDPRDDRFKEMLELKEREERKKLKEAKRRAKEDRMMAKLVEKTSIDG